MKIATSPAVRVEPEFRNELEALLDDGETLSQFVETSVRASVERRRTQSEFVARGLQSLGKTQKSGAWVDADTVLAKLQRKLDDARAVKAAASPAKSKANAKKSR